MELLNVCVTTYNHEPYIVECLESILAQQTDFAFKIIVGEDSSTDRTREICKEYQRKFPGIIELVLNDRSDNISINGKPTGRNNFINTLKASRSKYIALCEGDDYWADPSKLQKQVDFLENHDDYNLCFHDVAVLEQITGTLSQSVISREVPATTTIADLALGNYIHTPSVVLRNNFQLPQWFKQVVLGDWVFYMIVAGKGKIKKLSGSMAVYRIHESGTWSKIPHEKQILHTISTIDQVIDQTYFKNIKPLRQALTTHRVSLLNGLAVVREKNTKTYNVAEKGNLPALVSVCIPTFNGERYLMEALESIKHQSYPHLQIVVSDDSSIDGTLEIIENFSKAVAWEIKVVHHRPSGIGANWNNCIKYADGEFIKFLFQDDLLHPVCIETMVAALHNNPALGMVASKRDFTFPDINKVDFTDIWFTTNSNLQQQFNSDGQSLVLNKNVFSREDFFTPPRNKVGEPSCVLFRKSVFMEVGDFREDLKQILDMEYWCRILLKYDVLILPDAQVTFRIHDGQATNVNKLNNVSEKNKYREFLFDNIFPYLHKDLKKELFKQFHPIYRLKRRVFTKLYKIFGKSYKKTF